MKSASLSDVKNELSHLDKNELTELCLRLARYKKENKELLSYLLFDANEEENYKNNIKLLIDENFEAITQTNLYLVKKSLRKILRIANKHIKYSQNKETEIDVLIHFCSVLNHSKIPYKTNKVLNNLYNSQLKKINTCLQTLHEDLQYDFQKKLDKLS